MKRILIVDDSAFARATLRQILKGAGYEVFEASSGMEALELMPIVHPDLVTLDLLMPEMEGNELIGHLRAMWETGPLLVITADIQATTREALLKAGASAFLNKPVVGAELLKTVERLISQFGS